MADAVVSVFLEKLVNALMTEGRILIEFQDQLEEMKRQLKLMRGFLKDADRLRRKNHCLRAITDDLIELIHDADDILADCQTRISEKTYLLGNIVPQKLVCRFQIGKCLRDLNAKIDQIKQDMTSYLSPALVIQKDVDEFKSDVKRWSSPIFDRTQIIGLDDAAFNIKGWLFHASNGLNAVGIVGMGGLGKTTTAQKVFCDKEVEDYFEKRIWVSVSQTFKEEEIMRSILKNLGDAGIGDDAGELLKKIHSYLLDKTYLIVFDDVWSLRNGWWMRLADGLPKGNARSVIITTRIENVAQEMGVDKKHLHRPKLFTKEESWSLFSKIAFAGSGGRCLDSRLTEVGMEIVEKCGGLPLAIKAVGGVMLCKEASFVEWRRIADNFRDELAQNNDTVMASLQLSYDELPAHLKQCFLCFSIYPEDCIVIKDQLIHWWIGEGFVPANTSRLLIESAEDCFMNLINRCLVEVVDESYSGKVHTCKIHDLVHDLAIKIASEDAFCKSDNGHFRRWGLATDVGKGHLKFNRKLRALVSMTGTRKVNMVSAELVQKVRDCRNLRVLDLSESIFETGFEDSLNQIGSHRHLAYLCLRNIHPMIEIPESVEKLTNLLVLDLSFCHSLKLLPTYVINLSKLTVLDVSCCGSLEYFPRGLQKLINLQVLKGFKPSRSSSPKPKGCGIGELKSLSKLKILELLITRGNEIPSDELDVLSNLRQLQDLTISCFASRDDDLVKKLDRLSLPQQLHELSLKYFPGELTPSWLDPHVLPELQYLHLSNGNFSHFNPRFWGSGSLGWSLHGLMLEALPNLEEEWWRMEQSMPSLRVLNVSWCPKLEALPIADAGFKGGVYWKENGNTSQVDICLSETSSAI